MRIAQGVGGVMQIGYRTAARLGVWELEAVEGVMPQRFTLRAAVAFCDPFWSTRRPLTATLRVSATDALIFEGLDPAFAGGAMTATTFESPVDTTLRGVA